MNSWPPLYIYIKKIGVKDNQSKIYMYDYDLVVIGGGSGGLACSKEAASYGKRVAVIDYVKPSPHGTQWGLGGTCVNVGCIPKKLMHHAGLVGDVLKYDACEYGWQTSDNSDLSHNWELMVSNIQDYIKALNFGYKVSLRDASVVYHNKLASFVDEHTIACIDKKGTETHITAERFVVAVGSRPTALDCEGGELAISSDDIFSLEKAPGKTCCIGGGYVSLECAGFLSALGMDVAIYARSKLLRGFDRECCDKLEARFQIQGIMVKKGVVPIKIAKTEDSRLAVSFSDGSSDVFDTVVAAIGRTADTASLALENAGIGLLTEKHGKIECVREQTSVENIYAIGDVVYGIPELTPVAITSGRRLAGRLYDDSSLQMEYENIATAVYTPLEYGCVGLSEEGARAQYANVEVYHRVFIPLEYFIIEGRDDTSECFSKIIVDVDTGLVLGIHYMGPNAGDIIQGWALCVKKGITYRELIETVGVHPTCGEEIVNTTLSKSSGNDVGAAGC